MCVFLCFSSTCAFVRSFVLSPRRLDRQHTTCHSQYFLIKFSAESHTTHKYISHGVYSKQGGRSNNNDDGDGSGGSNHDINSDYINTQHTWYTTCSHTHMHAQHSSVVSEREPETNHSAVASRQSVVLRWRERIVEIDVFRLVVSHLFSIGSGKIKIDNFFLETNQRRLNSNEK